jgi:hypothetical protein
MVLYFLTFKFLDNRRENRSFPRIYSALNLFVHAILNR